MAIYKHDINLSMWSPSSTYTSKDSKIMYVIQFTILNQREDGSPREDQAAGFLEKRLFLKSKPQFGASRKLDFFLSSSKYPLSLSSSHAIMLETRIGYP